MNPLERLGEQAARNPPRPPTALDDLVQRSRRCRRRSMARRTAAVTLVFVVAFGFLGPFQGNGDPGKRVQTAADTSVEADPTASPVTEDRAATPTAAPTAGQPQGGDGWRLLVSRHPWRDRSPRFAAATTPQELDALERRLGVRLGEIDMNEEIVIAQTVPVYLRPEGSPPSAVGTCGPHILDNVRVPTEWYRYEILGGTRMPVDECPDAEKQQLFVVALDREGLPDMLSIENGLALIEIRLD